MSKVYLWAAAHEMTAEQKAELEQNGGKVALLSEIDKSLHKDLCNINPESNMRSHAVALVALCHRANAILVQPAGSPAFQNVLGQVNEQATKFNARVPICYAMSERKSEDNPQPDGSVKKVSVFKHLGFQYV